MPASTAIDLTDSPEKYLATNFCFSSIVNVFVIITTPLNFVGLLYHEKNSIFIMCGYNVCSEKKNVIMISNFLYYI